MLEILTLLLSVTKAPSVALPTFASLSRASVFQPGGRAVGNWRMQAALDLDLTAADAVRWLAGSYPLNLPRCIPLNNYWCVKKAGWAGELGVDAEGHVAFTSAEQGAVAAVTLLRRYYLGYGRRSARAILAHWAPAQCGLSVAAPDAQPPSPPISLAPLAKYGLGKTLRGRWLAAHSRGGLLRAGRSAGGTASKRSIVPDPLAAATRSPRIALDRLAPEPPLQLEQPLKAEKLRIASARPPPLSQAPPTPPLLDPPLAPPPVASCPGETARLANYAARAIEGIARSPDEDLKLFDTHGGPLPALPRLLANMAGVEIGPYRADAKLIRAAVEAVGSAPALPARRLGE
jgi:hypothetical protein